MYVFARNCVHSCEVNYKIRSLFYHEAIGGNSAYVFQCSVSFPTFYNLFDISHSAIQPVASAFAIVEPLERGTLSVAISRLRITICVFCAIVPTRTVACRRVAPCCQRAVHVTAISCYRPATTFLSQMLSVTVHSCFRYIFAIFSRV
jgi:hypothetical protein